MITYVVGNLFQSPAQVLVNPVNTAGFMSKGHFKRLYPAMLDQYRLMCEQQRLHIGDLWLYKTTHKWILNFPTKAHWRDAVKLENIEEGLRKFTTTYAKNGITSISFPLLGSGLGGQDWEIEIHPLLERYLGPLPIPVFVHIHEPNDRFATQLDEAALAAWLHGVPKIPPADTVWTDLFAILRQQPNLKTLDDDLLFQVRTEADHPLVFTSEKQPAQALSFSALEKVWATICEAGYVMPDDLPNTTVDSGLMVSLLAQLEYVRPVWLARPNEARAIGLHLVPPVSSLLRVVADD